MVRRGELWQKGGKDGGHPNNDGAGPIIQGECRRRILNTTIEKGKRIKIRRDGIYREGSFR